MAKNLFLSNARTFRRKIQEVLLTLWLEQRFTKQEILEIWLNRVYLGGGAWGVDAAAELYFGVPASRLELWQCAVIAGLPRAPSRFNPRADPRAAAARGARRAVGDGGVRRADRRSGRGRVGAHRLRAAPAGRWLFRRLGGRAGGGGDSGGH